jgi:hypothetical protein
MNTLRIRIASLAFAALLAQAAQAVAPAITSAAASSIATKSATVNGTLTAGGSATVSVHWGTSPNDLWCSASLGTFSEGAISKVVYSLLSGTTYSWCLRAVNADGEAWSEVRTFTTTSITANPRYGGGSYDGYASASAIVAIPPSASIIVVR